MNLVLFFVVKKSEVAKNIKPFFMNALLINETKGTPRIEFYPEGDLIIEGRSLPEDPIGFYTPVLEWIKKCTAENINLQVRFAYMNTSSSKEMFSFFRLLKNNPHIRNVKINWYYEEGDDVSYDAGQEFEALVNIPFQFHEYSEAAD